ncbi:Pilus assembly protein [Rhodovastum atsumiense]|uniref:Pilus assembly protein n=1 Tax=Rhodovastum atsumiense TaxID=504468 RepID=A0A5M6IZY9_9PROT|nr:TadE/TadG family type IV pilus assembly protein [Rhodovastum atsumiense]KAA5613902.1 pilus assembly protein [Rhodovastum atsumiense]CAH2602030.1 Pilus assembly protein [Rhodovastum atsumiense]
MMDRFATIGRLGRDRKGAVAIIFGLAVVTILLFVALAISFSGVIYARARLDTAADAAVLTTVMSAKETYEKNPFVSDFPTARQDGTNRFLAQSGSIPYVSNIVPQVSVSQTDGKFTATVTYSADYTLPLGGILGIPKQWSIGNTVGSGLDLSDAYLNVMILLDNTGSMEIGASPDDIKTLMQATACSLANAWYPTRSDSGSVSSISQNGTTYWQNAKNAGKVRYLDAHDYSEYACRTSANTYNPSNAGGLNCPITNPLTTPSSLFATGGNLGPACPNLPLETVTTCTKQWNDGTCRTLETKQIRPRAGAPCAFACHFDEGSNASSKAQDHLGIARANNVTLRFDLVKSAVRSLLQTMHDNELPVHNLRVNISAFANDVLKPHVYPADPDNKAFTFGYDWSAAMQAVGAPPTAVGQPETGIQPYIGPNGGDTDFTTTLNTLATALPSCTTTTPCNGASAATPNRVLFLITDGLHDPASRAMGGISVSACQKLKDKGYTIFVLYTPYYALMNPYYLDNDMKFVETGVVSGNLQSCASSKSHYIVASDSIGITAALQTFFRQAQATPARMTR